MNKKRLLILLIAVILVVIFTLILYFYLQKKQIQNIPAVNVPNNQNITNTEENTSFENLFFPSTSQTNTEKPNDTYNADQETKAVQATEQWWADTRKRWPIIDQLVTGNEGDHFDIDSINPEGNTDVNKIYFVIILDYPMSDSGNCGAMKRYKNDALDWIRSKGFDPNSMKITYENDFYHCLE